MKMKIRKAIKTMRRKGKITCGTERTLKALKEGNAKLIITAENTPKHIKQKIEQENKGKIPVKNFKGTSLELGEACKKPHIVTTVNVQDLGGISIQEIED